MTIFLELAKHFLIPRLQQVIGDLKEADAGWINTFRKTISMERNQLLSVEKQTMLESLIQKISTIQDADTDEETQENIEHLISTFRQQLLDKSLEYRIEDGGTTEPKLDALVGIVKDIFKSVTKLNVVDTPRNEDPLNCFKYFIGLYFAEKINARVSANLFNTVTRHPFFTNASSLSTATDQMLLGMQETESTPSKIELCATRLSKINPSLPNVASEHRLVVIAFAKELQDENIEIHKSFRS